MNNYVYLVIFMFLYAYNGNTATKESEDSFSESQKNTLDLNNEKFKNYLKHKNINLFFKSCELDPKPYYPCIVLFTRSIDCFSCLEKGEEFLNQINKNQKSSLFVSGNPQYVTTRINSTNIYIDSLQKLEKQFSFPNSPLLIAYDTIKGVLDVYKIPVAEDSLNMNKFMKENTF